MYLVDSIWDLKVVIEVQFEAPASFDQLHFLFVELLLVLDDIDGLGELVKRVVVALVEHEDASFFEVAELLAEVFVSEHFGLVHDTSIRGGIFHELMR